MPNFISKNLKEVSTGVSATGGIEAWAHGLHAIHLIVIVTGLTAILIISVIEYRHEKNRKRPINHYGIIRML